MRKKLPKEVFVTWDSNGISPDEAFLLADTTLEGQASKGEKVIVGTYKLVREDVVQLVTKVSQRKVRG